MTWYLQEPPLLRNLSFVKFLDENTGYIVGRDGTIFRTTNGGDSPTPVDPNANLPRSFALMQNYPNPFNPSTIIGFDVPYRPGFSGSDMVNISVYDITGKRIAVLVNSEYKAGYYEVEWNAPAMASGVYIYKFISGDFIESKRMILLK